MPWPGQTGDVGASNVVPFRKADHYQDPVRDDSDLWRGRDYEDAAERMAITRMLKGKHFRHAVDVSGGCGRLTALLAAFADTVTLADPSPAQLSHAGAFLADHPNIERKLWHAADLGLPDCSVDLVMMVGLLLHIPDPEWEFREASRVLAPGGHLLLQFANYAHIRNRLMYQLRHESLPADAVDVRSPGQYQQNDLPFVNHNPTTVTDQLRQVGLRADKVLSVSNLRVPLIQRVLPAGVALSAERLMQEPLARFYCGPSIFVLAAKVTTAGEWWDMTHHPGGTDR